MLTIFSFKFLIQNCIVTFFNSIKDKLAKYKCGVISCLFRTFSLTWPAALEIH